MPSEETENNVTLHQLYNLAILLKLKQLLSAILLLSASSTCFPAIKTSEMVPHDLSAMPVYGTLAPDAEARYSRLPDSLKGAVREDLWALGLHSAGIAIRFSSDATDLGASWKALQKFSMNHMTPAGIRGLDLYVMQPDSTWTTLCSARPSLTSHHNKSLLANNMPREKREYMLYMPLYDGVDSVFILTDSTATVSAPEIDLPKREKPFVMYGTSILQGGCASRPGMVHTSILGRMFNREVINLGFSGNARLDPEIARLMAQADAAVYVIDTLPNCTSDMINERLDTFIDIIREKRPDTPILLVESPMFPISRFCPDVFDTLTEKNKTLRAIYERRSEQDGNIHYMESAETLSDPESTVDNYHFTDTGFDNMARAMYPILKKIMKE